MALTELQSVLNCNVLVLNKHYMPLRIIGVKRALCMLCRELAEVISYEQGRYYNYNFENIIKILGWSMIPVFLLFVPFGTILILKNWEKRNIFIILVTIFTLIPGFYALLRFADVRYLFPTYPMFCIISLFAIKWYDERFVNKKLLIIVVIA